MGIEPQCQRFVTSLTDETAYGTATADGSLTKMFHMVDPILPDENREIIDDSDLLKGHEWRSEVNAYQVLFTDRTLTLSNVPANAQFLAWLLARAMGDVTTAQVGSTGDYTHTMLPMDRCADGRQLPSATIGLLYSGDSAENLKFKGCVVDSVTVRVSNKGRVTVDATIITDGTEGDGSGISVPASFASTHFYYGKDFAIEYEPYGGGTAVDISTVVRSFEFTINNNLDVDAAKNTNFQQTGSLSKLEFGNREFLVSLDILDDDTTDLSIAPDLTMVALTATLGSEDLSGGTEATTVIVLPRTLFKITGRRWDGMDRVAQLVSDPFYDTVTSTPVQVVVTTRDTAVL